MSTKSPAIRPGATQACRVANDDAAQPVKCPHQDHDNIGKDHRITHHVAWDFTKVPSDELSKPHDQRSPTSALAQQHMASRPLNNIRVVDRIPTLEIHAMQPSSLHTVGSKPWYHYHDVLEQSHPIHLIQTTTPEGADDRNFGHNQFDSLPTTEIMHPALNL